MNTSIVSISPAGSHASHIIVDSGFADSLNRYLNEQAVTVTPPREAISRTIRIYRTPQGRIEREEEALDHEFDAQASPSMIEGLVGDWLKTIL